MHNQKGICLVPPSYYKRSIEALSHAFFCNIVQYMFGSTIIIKFTTRSELDKESLSAKHVD